MGNWFVSALSTEPDATFKENMAIYFDENRTTDRMIIAMLMSHFKKAEVFNLYP